MTTTEESPAQSTAPRSSAPGFTSTDLILLLMAIIWGVNISVVKRGTQTLPPLTYNALRVCIAAVTLLAIGYGARKAWPSRAQVTRLLMLGMLGNGVYQILFIQGISRTKAGNAALVLAATPAIIAFLGRMHRVEEVRVRALMGIGISVGGVLLVVGTSAMAATDATLLGDFLVFLGCICWAFFTVLLQPYTQHVSGVQLAGLTMTGGLPLLFAAALPQMRGVDWGSVPAEAWYSMLFSGLGALVLAYLFWYRGMKVLGPTRTAMYANLQPAVALVFAWLLLGEVPTVLQGLGAAGIIGGIVLARS